jgi:hypothetical protein
MQGETFSAQSSPCTSEDRVRVHELLRQSNASGIEGT